MGASLEQWISNSWKPLAFFSLKFSPAQRVYSIYDREPTAIYEAIRHFRYFLEGQTFTIVTDHKHTSIYCDLTVEARRPIIASSLRERVFKQFHYPAHPSAKVTDRVIRKRYVWESMRREISDWCKECHECQQSKILRYSRVLQSNFTTGRQ